MTRFVSIPLMLFGLFITPVVFGGCGSNEPVVIEQTETYQPSETDLEMESAEYEKAMNEMQ